MEFNSQICTTRSQSEALLKLGLKKETADMYITNMSHKGLNYTDDWQIGSISYCDVDGNLYEPSERIPCPFCNKEEFFKHFDCEDEKSMGKEVYESIVRWVKKHYPDYVIED